MNLITHALKDYTRMRIVQAESRHCTYTALTCVYAQYAASAHASGGQWCPAAQIAGDLAVYRLFAVARETTTNSGRLPPILGELTAMLCQSHACSLPRGCGYAVLVLCMRETQMRAWQDAMEGITSSAKDLLSGAQCVGTGCYHSLLGLLPVFHLVQQ